MIIYVATNKISGRRYVGATTLALQARIRAHSDLAKHPPRGRKRSPFHEAIHQVGTGGFRWEHVATCADRIALAAAERFYVRELRGAADLGGYNVAAGGPGNSRKQPTDEIERRRNSMFGKRNALKLHEAAVPGILAQINAGISRAAIARKLGVHSTTIGNAIRRHSERGAL